MRVDETSSLVFPISVACGVFLGFVQSKHDLHESSYLLGIFAGGLSPSVNTQIPMSVSTSKDWSLPRLKYSKIGALSG